MRMTRKTLQKGAGPGVTRGFLDGQMHGIGQGSAQAPCFARASSARLAAFSRLSLVSASAACFSRSRSHASARASQRNCELHFSISRSDFFSWPATFARLRTPALRGNTAGTLRS